MNFINKTCSYNKIKLNEETFRLYTGIIVNKTKIDLGFDDPQFFVMD